MAQSPQRVRLIRPPGDRGPTAMFLRNAKIALLTDWRSLMANVEFTQEELEALDEKERALLLTVFTAVIDLVKGSRTGVGAAERTPPADIQIQAQGAGRPATLAALHEQFSSAFTSGGDIGSVIMGEAEIRIIPPPPPPPPGG